VSSIILTFDKDIRFIDDACLYFQRSKGKEPHHSSVKKCIFDGIDVGEGFLIRGYVYEKVSGPTVYIEECSFRNCVTKRKSGKIIKEYDRYLGLFKRAN